VWSNCLVNFFHVLCNPIVSQLRGLFMFTQVEKYPPKKLLICNEFRKQMIPCEIFFFPCGRISFQQKNEKVVSWEKCCLSFGYNECHKVVFANMKSSFTNIFSKLEKCPGSLEAKVVCDCRPWLA